MRNTLLCIMLLSSASLAAQKSPAGVEPLSTQTATGVTRAVVVGISNYEDEKIPDLQYAHRDAEAFAAWLRSPAGGAVPGENIKLYTDSDATSFQIGYALGELIRDSKTGDRAIIYLSGHGDSETDSGTNLGFFLAYDSPPNVYWGNAFAMQHLQVLTNAMSRKGVEVLVISDACRSGKLAGSEFGGAQATALQLASQIKNEMLILSCQPDEYSYESDQWGGGRGVFSFILEQALYGLADYNQNAELDLREIRNYLEEQVPAKAAPNRQNPLINGPIMARIAAVDPPSLALYQERMKDFSTDIADTRGKAPEQFPDSLLYQRFLAAIEAGHMLEPAGESANDYYKTITSNPDWTAYRGQVERKFVVALADEAQSVINKFLRTDPRVLDDAYPGRVRYAHIPAYLARATEILGDQHYLYPYLKAKQFYFESKMYSNAHYPGFSTDTLAKLSLRALDSALAYDPRASYLYFEKGINYYWKKMAYDTAAAYFKKALDLSPTWVLALYYYGYCLSGIEYMKSGDMSAGVPYLKQAIQYDSTFLPAYERLGFFVHPDLDAQRFWWQAYVQKMNELMARDPDNIPSVYYRYMGLTLIYLARYAEAEQFLLKGAEMTNWEDPIYYKQLARVYIEQGKIVEARKMYECYLEVNPKGVLVDDLYLHIFNFQRAYPLALANHKWDLENETVFACDLYRLYYLNHYFKESRRIGQSHVEAGKSKEINGDQIPLQAHGQWYYGDPALAKSTLTSYVEQVESSGDEQALLDLKRPFGPYSQLVIYNLAQGNVEAAEYWYEKNEKQDAFQDPNFFDGWGYGPRTWLAYTRGRFEEVDSLIALYSATLNLADLIEDMLLLVSITGDVDYPIFILEKTRVHFPKSAALHFHLARLYLEQKNDYEKGLPLLELAVQLDGADDNTWYHLAAACAHLGKNDAALEHLKTAFENGYADFEELEADARWNSLRGTAPFEAILSAYRKK